MLVILSFDTRACIVIDFVSGFVPMLNKEAWLHALNTYSGHSKSVHLLHSEMDALHQEVGHSKLPPNNRTLSQYSTTTVGSLTHGNADTARKMKKKSTFQYKGITYILILLPHKDANNAGLQIMGSGNLAEEESLLVFPAWVHTQEQAMTALQTGDFQMTPAHTFCAYDLCNITHTLAVTETMGQRWGWLSYRNEETVLAMELAAAGSFAVPIAPPYKEKPKYLAKLTAQEAKARKRFASEQST